MGNGSEPMPHAQNIEGWVELARSGNPAARLEAVGKLILSRSEAALQVLLAAIDDEEANVRAVAARGLGHFDSPLPIPRLLSVLNDSDERVRQEAGRALGLLGPVAVRDALERGSDLEPILRHLLQHLEVLLRSEEGPPPQIERRK